MKKNIIIIILTVLCLLTGYMAYREWSDTSIDYPDLYNEEFSYINGSGFDFDIVDVESEIPSERFSMSNEMAVKIGVAVLETYIKPEEFEKMSIGLSDIESKGYFVVTAYYKGILGGGTSVAILKKNGKILKVFGGE